MQTPVKQSQKNSSISFGSGKGSGDDIPTDPRLSEGSGGNISNGQTNLLQEPISESPEIPGSSSPNQHRSKHTHANTFFGVDQLEEDCVESDCDDPLSHKEKIRCAGPGCNTMVCFITLSIYTQS